MLRLGAVVTSLALVGCSTQRSHVGPVVTDVTLVGTRLAFKTCDLDHVTTDASGAMAVLTVLTLGAALAGGGGAGAGGGATSHSATVSGCQLMTRSIAGVVVAKPIQREPQR